jgi:hypothetical protein
MAKLENLSAVEVEIFKFLRASFNLSRQELKQAFKDLLYNLKQFEESAFEARAFSYLDIISWLESKIYDKPVADVIREKYIDLTRRKRLKVV